MYLRILKKRGDGVSYDLSLTSESPLGGENFDGKSEGWKDEACAVESTRSFSAELDKAPSTHDEGSVER